MITCISISKLRMIVKDKVDEMLFNYKMMSDKHQEYIKTIFKISETTFTITLLLSTSAYASSSDKIIEALNPLVDLMQSIGYPLAILSMSGGAITMMFNKRLGIKMIKDTGIAFLVLQFIPGIMKILLEVGRALRA